MLSTQKIIFFKQLIASMQEALFALEQASKTDDAKKFNEIKKELMNLDKEIRGELSKIKTSKTF